MGREFVSLVEQLKQKLKDLYAEREASEEELNMLASRLPADPGMHGPLIDSEGFPRADIDIASIRAQRQKIISKRTHSTLLHTICVERQAPRP
jgi:hypothetical protein